MFVTLFQLRVVKYFLEVIRGSGGNVSKKNVKDKGVFSFKVHLKFSSVFVTLLARARNHKNYNGEIMRNLYSNGGTIQ